MNSDTMLSIISRVRFQAIEEQMEVSDVLDLLEEEIEEEFNYNI